MFTLFSPRLLSPRSSPRVSPRRATSHNATLRVNAVLKNGGFRNGDARRREDDVTRDVLKPNDTPPRNMTRKTNVAMDGPAPLASSRPGDATQENNSVKRKYSQEEEPDLFLFHEADDANDKDDVPLYESMRSDFNALAADKTKVGTTPNSRWPAFSNTAVEFDEEFALRRGAVAPLVTPPWRVMLLSDGSVTRHLQLLTDSSVRVDVLRQELVNPCAVSEDASVPADVIEVLTRDVSCVVAGDGVKDTSQNNKHASTLAKMVHREVDLCDSSDGTPLVYASSWWTEEAATGYGILQANGGASNKPVWNHLSAGKTELYREVKRVYLGSSPRLEKAWNTTGPFWARHYIFWAGSQPLCVIYEVFSPSLERFLGGKDVA